MSILGIFSPVLLCLGGLMLAIGVQTRRRKKQIIHDLEAQGYTQIKLEEIRIHAGVFGRAASLSFYTGLNNFWLVLERVPRSNTHGYKWLPYAEYINGGRDVVTPRIFGEMIGNILELNKEMLDKVANHSRKTPVTTPTA